MSATTAKYSLWICPADPGLEQLVSSLAREFEAPAFVPHITVVANIMAANSELPALRDRVSALAGRLRPHQVTLDRYGMTGEEYRCLFLEAAASPWLDAMYAAVTELFPQVANEHFAGRPHLSVLYGEYAAERKLAATKAHPVAPLTFTVGRLELYRTDGSPETWEFESEYTLRG